MNKINVVFVSDVKTIDYCIVSMLSVLKNKADDDYVHFYFIADEFIKFYHKYKFNCLRTSSSDISFIRVNSSDYNIFRQSTLREDLPNNSYYRLGIAKNLVNEAKALYVDFDTCTLGSLSELYSINVDEYYIAAVKDIWEIQRMKELESVGIRTKVHYNSGVLLLNLKRWREEDVFQKLLNYAESHPKKFILADQFLINSVIQDSVKIIDYKYNLQLQQHFEPIQYTDLVNYNKNIKTPVIIHYIFGKPWEFSKCQHPWRHKWWETAHEYPYYEELLINCLTKTQNQQPVQEAGGYIKNCLKYCRARLLTYVTFGKTRAHYSKKADRFRFRRNRGR